ncbi:phytoene desaturase family protein [Cohnella suwonensis]|uniref:Phytoene desaturase family protein n=1 Tax=Cohnella suwonensis TaxID=696072 RepID=A0ABW0LUI4_9BACL
MENNANAYDVAVIGGGAAGLIAAIDLARSGLSVVLLEKAHKLGGRAMTVEKNGARFNLGGHALYLDGEANAIFREYGLRLDGGPPQTKGVGIWNGKLPPLPGGAAALLTSKLLSWPGKIELARIMTKLPKLDTEALSEISLREWAEREIRDPMVRNMTYALCRTSTYNKDIDLPIAGPVLRQLERSLRKDRIRYLDGGWQTIVDQLRDLALRSGATILTGQSVADIEHDGAVLGLRLSDGTTLSVPRVVSALAPRETFRLVRDADHTALRGWKEDARPAMAACLDLALRKLPVPGRNLAIGLDRPIFASNHSFGAKLSDNGDQVVHLVKYNMAGEGNPQEDERILEQAMTLLHPNWQAELVGKQFLPTMTVCHDFMHLRRRDRRPGPAVPEIRGLYVAGDWASHGEWLLDAAAASARRASKRIIEELAREGTGDAGRALAAHR